MLSSTMCLFNFKKDSEFNIQIHIRKISLPCSDVDFVHFPFRRNFLQSSIQVIDRDHFHSQSAGRSRSFQIWFQWQEFPEVAASMWALLYVYKRHCCCFKKIQTGFLALVIWQLVLSLLMLTFYFGTRKMPILHGVFGVYLCLQGLILIAGPCALWIPSERWQRQFAYLCCLFFLVAVLFNIASIFVSLYLLLDDEESHQNSKLFFLGVRFFILNRGKLITTKQFKGKT